MNENVQIPVKDSESGRMILEAWNPGGKQSDGSMWTKPRPMVPETHEHSYKMASPAHREIRCDCGHGGRVYPHQVEIRDKVMYAKGTERVIAHLA